MHYVINFVFSIGKQPNREAINFVRYILVVYINYTYLYAYKLSLSFVIIDIQWSRPVG